MSGGRRPVRAAIAGLVCLVLAGLGGLIDVQAALRGWLVAWLCWMQLPLGALAWILALRLAGGHWSRPLLPALIAGSLTWPLMALLFLPVLFGLPLVYPWAAPDYAAANTAWLNTPFFVLRFAGDAILWTGLALLLAVSDSRGLAAGGAVLYALTASFAVIDWQMSLDPAFSSSIYGLLGIADQLLAGFAFAIIGVLAGPDPGGGKLAPPLSAVLIGVLMLWLYLAFMQYLVAWSGDEPAEARWFLRRGEGVWQGLLWLGGVLLGALPLLVLASADARRSRTVLIGLSALILVMKMVETVWRTAPDFAAPGPWFVPELLLALAGFGGLWLAGLGWVARRAPRPDGAPAHA